MTGKSLARRGHSRVALLGMVWMLLAGQGLCGPAPEPLQNRQTQTESVPGVVAPGGNAVVVPQEGVSASGSGGNQDTAVIVTPPVVGASPAVSGNGVPVTPGMAVPMEEGKPLPGSKVPGQVGGPEVKDGSGSTKATATGGNQDTKIFVTPPVVAVPAAVIPGKDGAAAGPGNTGPVTPPAVRPDGKALDAAFPGPNQTGPGVPQDGHALQVAPDGKVFDEAGRPVALPPGQEVPLPKGGKIVDGQGQVVTVPPGGRVVAAVRSLTPGDFLPKAGEAKKPPQHPAEPKHAKPQVEPVPDKVGKPQSEAAPQAGDRFKISQDACQKHTLGFLKGCWEGRPVMRDKTKVSTRLCFDENGVGKRIDKNFSSNIECVAPLKAAWAGSSLSFSFQSFHCSDGRPRYDVPVVCNGCGEKTQCIGSEYRDGRGMIGKTQYEIVKE